MSRVRVNPVQKSRVSEDLTPTISSLFPSSYLEIREDWKLANQRPVIRSFCQSESRKQSWLSSISPSCHSADHSLASESLIDIFFIIFFSGYFCYLFFWDHMLGAINNQDKYGESRVILLTARVHEKTASDHSGPILLSSLSLNPKPLIHQVPKFERVLVNGSN